MSGYIESIEALNDPRYLEQEYMIEVTGVSRLDTDESDPKEAQFHLCSARLMD